MNSIIEQHRQAVERLCRRLGVKTLELFGSASDGSFDPVHSDLDFLVEFLPLPEGQLAPDYFGLLHGLEDTFHCKIDLVMDRAIRNPYFRRSVNRTRRVVYAA
jgi:hypothetical protein